MTETRPTGEGAFLALVCCVLGWALALVLLVLAARQETRFAYLIEPSGIPKGLFWCLAPLTLLFWLVGGAWGGVELVRAGRSGRPVSERRVAQAAIALACLPVIAYLILRALQLV